MSSHQWLLLAFQLPTHPSNARVKTWRRLQQVGAVPTRNAVYVLPNTDQCREDFEWLRGEIGAQGGSATVFAADALDSEGEEDIVAAFHRARDADYRALKRDADRLLPGARRKAPRDRGRLTRGVRALRERFSQIERIDFHQAAARAAAAESLAALDRATMPAPAKRSSGDPPTRVAASFHRRRWVTRPGPGVDRMASAWLIRRFIDPNATFAFVATPAKTDVPFDMYGGEFSHQGGRCTFEVLCDRFGVAAPAVTQIGRVVHDLDLKETKYGLPETPAVGRMIDGLRAMYADDHTLLEQGVAMFEALARSFGATNDSPRRTQRTRGKKKRTQRAQSSRRARRTRRKNAKARRR